MPLFQDIIGQERAITLLRQALASGRAHAFLMAGPSGVGKLDAALELAAGLVCPEEGCGDCGACRRVREGLHPDVELLAPEGTFVTVDQIREVNREVALRPFEAHAKVTVLVEAEAMNKEAANAFLKTLEEPPSHAYFILVTDAPEQLLETIVSRCLRIQFNRTPVPQLVAHLRDRFDLGELDAIALARVAQGNLARARELASDPSSRERRALLLGWARELPQAGDIDVRALLEEMLRSVEGWSEERVGVLEQRRKRDLEWAADARSRARVEKTYEQRIRREKRRAATECFREIIDTFSAWYRDLACVALGAEDAILNFDYLYELQEAAFPGLVPAYLQVLAVLKGAAERFRYNVDARLALTDMILASKEILT
jgi:DNA polymerase III subunit delta'